jgi:hypothetical protein
VLFEPRALRRLLGVLVPITPTFPLLGPLGIIPLPSQWRIRFGAPIWFDDVTAERARIRSTSPHARASSRIDPALLEELPGADRSLLVAV